MLHLSIDVGSADELREHLLGLVNLFAAESPAIEPAVPAVRTEEPTEEPKSKEEPKPKEEPKKPSIDDVTVRKVLNDLMQTRGRESVRTLLNDFGASSFPTLKTEHYEAVIAKAKEMSNAAD